MAGMTEVTFSRNFQTYTGHGFIGHGFVQFLNVIRVGQACARLDSSDEQITTSAQDAGFKSLANFNRHFRRQKGMTPSQ